MATVIRSKRRISPRKYPSFPCSITNSSSLMVLEGTIQLVYQNEVLHSRVFWSIFQRDNIIKNWHKEYALHRPKNNQVYFQIHLKENKCHRM